MPPPPAPRHRRRRARRREPPQLRQRRLAEIQIVAPRIPPQLQQAVVGVRARERRLVGIRQVEVIDRHRRRARAQPRKQLLKLLDQRRLAAALRRADAQLCVSRVQ